MHIVILVVIGLAALATFWFGAGILGKTGAQGAAAFIWLWLAVAIGNGIFGIVRAGIPVLNEIGAFVPIFGIPAAIAWYLAYRTSAAS